ncbi:hypothetical protein EV361DRAFT_967450 [Lentinula raphanica]|nr:hypothetical protein EV361DRAFT_967450 [Lentinula raphanica]
MPSFPLPLAAAVFYSHPIGPIPSLRLLSPLADAMTIPNPFPSTKLIVEKWWIDIAGAGRVTKREAEAKGGTEYTAGQPTPIITLNASRVHRLHPFITSLPSSPREQIQLDTGRSWSRIWAQYSTKGFLYVQHDNAIGEELKYPLTLYSSLISIPSRQSHVHPPPSTPQIAVTIPTPSTTSTPSLTLSPRLARRDKTAQLDQEKCGDTDHDAVVMGIVGRA